ncbi:hypothetical protein OC834_003672 [Tilletia horrida]|nr:hypothetical protein OC834_003672 [Tilletia horrida]
MPSLSSSAAAAGPSSSSAAPLRDADVEAEPLLHATTPTSPRSAADDDDHHHHHHHHHLDDDEDDEEAHHAGAAEGAIPFPSQPDPARRFRPKHYRTKRNLDKLQAWAHHNTGFLLLALAQVFYATMALFFKILNDLPPLPVHNEGAHHGGSADAPPHKEQAIGALQVIVVRMAITALGCFAYLLLVRDPHPFLGPPPVRRLLALRGFSGFFGLFGLYFSLQFLSLADATCITFLSPLATALLAAAVLKEQLHSRQLVAGIACIAGVVCIARPQFLFGRTPHGDLGDIPVPGGDEGGGIGDGQHLLEAVAGNGGNALAAAAGPVAGPIGAVVASAAATATSAFFSPSSSSSAISSNSIAAFARDPVTASATPSAHLTGAGTGNVTEAERILAVGVALLGVLGSAGAYTSLRCIGSRASPTHSVAYFSTWSLFVAGLGMILTGQEFIVPTDVRWMVLMVLIGLCGLAAQIFAAMGLAREKAGRATVAVYLQAPLTVLYQITLLRTPLEPLSALGSGIILLASIWVSMSKS